MEDNFDATASFAKELMKKIGSSGGDKEPVSPEQEEYCTESFDCVN